MKILVVDDDPVERRTLAGLLKKCGHEVLECRDGEEGWNSVLTQNVRFVISDWMMPKLSGIDLCRRIRGAALDRYVYVILSTSRSEKADFIAGMDAGADDFMTKPIELDGLRVRVRAGERILNLERTLADKNQELEAAHGALQTAYECIREDLRAAFTAQLNLLPPPAFNAMGITCRWRFRPSSLMSGDIFNFFAVDDRNVGFYLLDVSGHGVPAAMCSMVLSSVLLPDASGGSLLRSADRRCNQAEAAEPHQVIRDLNERFQTKDDRYFTMIYGVVNTETSMLRLAQAGNPSPVMIASDGSVRAVGSGGMPVGLWPDIEFDSVEVPFRRGDRILLYSDGVSECANSECCEFGDARVLDHLTVNARQSMDAMLNGLEQRLEAWRGSTAFADDVSVLALEFTGEQVQ